MYIVSSEANCVEWWIRVRVMDIQSTIEGLGITEHTETMEFGVIHRRILAMIDSVNIIGHRNIQLAMTSEIDTWSESTCTHVKEIVIQVRGDVLDSIGGLSDIDWQNCTMNGITEVNVVLGIEAATAVLFAKLRETILWDTYVDLRHIMLISDTMTHNGFIILINRHALEKTTSGPVARCSFEETVEVLKGCHLRRG